MSAKTALATTTIRAHVDIGLYPRVTSFAMSLQYAARSALDIDSMSNQFQMSGIHAGVTSTKMIPIEAFDCASNQESVSLSCPPIDSEGAISVRISTEPDHATIGATWINFRPESFFYRWLRCQFGRAIRTPSLVMDWTQAESLDLLRTILGRTQLANGNSPARIMRSAFASNVGNLGAPVNRAFFSIDRPPLKVMAKAPAAFADRLFAAFSGASGSLISHWESLPPDVMGPSGCLPLRLPLFYLSFYDPSTNTHYAANGTALQ